MSGLTLAAYYLLFWWLTLFAVLSIGLRTQDEEGEVIPGTEPSAPARSRIWRNLLINTVLSGVLFGIWYYVTQIMGIGIEEISKWMPGPPER